MQRKKPVGVADFLGSVWVVSAAAAPGRTQARMPIEFTVPSLRLQPD
jgi:hypothetical protein